MVTKFVAALQHRILSVQTDEIPKIVVTHLRAYIQKRNWEVRQVTVLNTGERRTEISAKTLGNRPTKTWRIFFQRSRVEISFVIFASGSSKDELGTKHAFM